MSLEDQVKPESFGPFVLLRQLGAGGMGSAHLALHPESDTLLVVKRMHPELLQDDTIFKRFVHEAEVAAHVRHPNVASLVAMGTVDGEPFLATEYVFGVQLSTIIDRVENSIIELVPLPIAMSLALEIISGVEAIHEAVHLETGEPLGLIHRDIGARNVLVGFDGHVRIIDMGLGKSILSDWQTAHQVLAGSPDYMPPEQAMGARVDGRADVYAAAVTIWELLSGKKRIREDGVAARLSRAIAAQPEPLLPYRPDASERLEAILKNAMATDPERRTPTARILKKTLQEEHHKIAKNIARDEIITWLDTACATVIAKERRRLEEAKESARLVLGKGEAKTELFVGRPDGLLSTPAAYRFYTPEEREPKQPEDESGWRSTLVRAVASETVSDIASLVDPANLKNAPLRIRILVAVAAFLSLTVIAVGTALILTPSPGEVSAEALPVDPADPTVTQHHSATKLAPPVEPRPLPPPVEPFDPELEDDPDLEDHSAQHSQTAPPLVEPPPSRALPPSVPAEVEARKRRLINRLRRLRKVSFDLRWQNKLTRLSSKLSRARNMKTLDEVDLALTRMEQRGH